MTRLSAKKIHKWNKTPCLGMTGKELDKDALTRVGCDSFILDTEDKNKFLRDIPRQKQKWDDINILNDLLIWGYYPEEYIDDYKESVNFTYLSSKPVNKLNMGKTNNRITSYEGKGVLSMSKLKITVLSLVIPCWLSTK